MGSEMCIRDRVKTVMSIFWIVLYTVVNLTAVMWLGSIAVNTLTGVSLFWGMAGLAAFALAYSMYGGLKAVALTDILQVIILVLGGIIIAWLTMGMIGGDNGVLGGFKRLYTELPGKFDMILANDHPACLLYTSPSPRDATLSRMPSSA